MAASMTAPALDLGLPTDWLFKGEGAANVVYEYTGSLPHLVGKVLKVRKSLSSRPSPAQALLESRVWEPVLGPHDAGSGAAYSAAMAREILYVQRCLVPLLGAEHVPQQEPVSVPTAFLRQLSSASAPLRGCSHALDSPGPAGPAGLALLMPDVTKLPALPPVGTAVTPSSAVGGVPVSVPEPVAPAATGPAGPAGAAAAEGVVAEQALAVPSAAAAAGQVQLACGSERALSDGEGSDMSSSSSGGGGAEDRDPNVRSGAGSGAAFSLQGMAGSGAALAAASLLNDTASKGAAPSGLQVGLPFGLACGNGARSPFEGCPLGSRDSRGGSRGLSSAAEGVHGGIPSGLEASSGRLFNALEAGGRGTAVLAQCTAGAGPRLELRVEGKGLLGGLEDSAEVISLSPREGLSAQAAGAGAAGAGAGAGESYCCAAAEAAALVAGRADSAADLSMHSTAGGSGGGQGALRGVQHAEQQQQQAERQEGQKVQQGLSHEGAGSPQRDQQQQQHAQQGLNHEAAGSPQHAQQDQQHHAQQQRHVQHAQQQQQQAQQQHAQQGFTAGSPVLCVEIKPKCGFVGDCSTVHPDNRIKHSRSRYQLHQLLKLSEGKVEVPSTYDPTDLFSGDPERMLRALRALLAHPQNNLRMFWRGRPVGVRQGVQAWAVAAGAAARVEADVKEASGDDAAAVGALVVKRDGKGAAGSKAAAAEIPSGGSAGAAGALPEAVGCSGAEGPDGSADRRAGAVYGAAPQESLLAVLLRVLLVEGVLQRLLAAQQQCPYDIEGIHALYCKLLEDSAACTAGAAGTADACQAPSSCGGGSSVWEEEGVVRRGQQRRSAAAESGASGAVSGSCGGRESPCVTVAQSEGSATPESGSWDSCQNPSRGAAAPADAAGLAGRAAAARAGASAPAEPATRSPSQSFIPVYHPSCSHETLAEATASYTVPSPGLNTGNDPSCSHEAALQRLLALAPCAAHAVLRQYVVSATARDCALMVSLQRLGGRQSPPEAAAGLGGSWLGKGQPEELRNLEGVQQSKVQLHGGAIRLQEAQPGGVKLPPCNGASKGGGAASQQAQQPAAPASRGEAQQAQHAQQAAAAATKDAVQHAQHAQQAAAPPTKLLYCPEAGGWYRYRVAFVDLDMKALAKIPKHFALDQRILAAARMHGVQGGAVQ